MKAKNVLILLGAAILLSTLFIACETAPTGPIVNAAGQNVSGTATGTAPGYMGEVSVTLTLENGFITNVVAAAPHDTPMFAAPVISRAQSDMVRFNVPQIDNVSGSTITVMGINQAAQNALNQLLGN